MLLISTITYLKLDLLMILTCIRLTLKGEISFIWLCQNRSGLLEIIVVMKMATCLNSEKESFYF